MATKVEELITQAKGSPDWRERRLAFIGLGYVKGRDVLPVLLEGLHDPLGDVRHAAILALGRRGETQAMPELLRPRIIASPEVRIRWAAASVLGKLGDHRVIDPLVNLVDDEEWLVRNEALVVLRDKVEEIVRRRDLKLARILVRMLNLPDAGIVEMAVEGLRDLGTAASPLLDEAIGSVWEPIRLHAARVMGLVGDPAGVRSLVRLLGDESPNVRAEAATALGLIKNPAALRPLIDTLGDFNEEVRRSAVAALVRFGADAVTPLVIALEHTKQKLAKCAAISALGTIGDVRALPILIQHQKSGYHLVRLAAIAALPRFGAAAVEPLRARLSFNRSDISGLLREVTAARDLRARVRAVRALGDLEDHRAVPLLTSILSDTERDLAIAAQEALEKIGRAAWGRRGATTVLGLIGNPSVTPEVHALLDDDSANVRRAAVQTLGELGAVAHVDRLAAIVRHDPESLVRHSALNSLRELAPGAPVLFNAALAALGDEAGDVRVRAVRIVGELPEERAVAPLLLRLADAFLSVRTSAETALVNLDGAAIPGLLHLLREGPLVARRRAASALGRIGDPIAVAPLEAARDHDEDPGTVQCARDALRLLRHA